MLTRTKLSKEQLSKLTSLINCAKKPEGSDLEYYKRAVVGVLKTGSGTVGNNFKVNGSYCVPFGVPNNPELVNWLEEFTKIEGKYINSIHTFEYTEGSSTKPHYDVNSNKTMIFVLNKAEEGGQFIFENNLLDVEEGEVLDYDGSKMKHGVTKVIKGYRRVFVAWFSPKERGALI
tara:strand:- start:682 stop:1206 length:525 start_codon:yes stop_codon:yes gene_type:complete